MNESDGCGYHVHMSNTALWIVYFSMAAVLTVFGVVDCASATDELPSVLVVRFEASASDLEQGAIRYAIEHELGVPVTEQGSADAATLWVAVREQGELTLRYQPERSTLARAVPLIGVRDTPALVARLAGNLVRDQAGALVQQLKPSPAPTTAMAAGPAQAEAAQAQQAAPRAVRGEKAREDRWLFNALVGAAFGRNTGTALTLSQAFRLGRFDLSCGVDLGAARMDATIHGVFGGRYDVRITELELTLWTGADVRVIGSPEAQLKFGAVAGYRLVGIKVPGNVSGSEGDFTFAPRLTATFRIRGQHSVLLRTSWFVTPREHLISSGLRTKSGEVVNGTVHAKAFPMVVQIGYQVGF